MKTNGYRMAENHVRKRLDESVESAFSDSNLSPSATMKALLWAGEDYCRQSGLPVREAASHVGAAVRKAVERTELAKARKPKPDRDPPEEEDATMATKSTINETMHELALSKRREGETSAQAFARWYTTDPDARLWKQAYRNAPITELEVPPVRKLAPVAAVVETRAAEIRKAQPHLSEDQARARVYLADKDLFRKALAEQRGDAAA